MNTAFDDKEMINDILANQKLLTGIYNVSSNECADDALRNDMLTILREEHNIQANVFKEMRKRGWYTTQDADASSVNQAKAKFNAIQPNL